jgi:hypothetical protein
VLLDGRHEVPKVVEVKPGHAVTGDRRCRSRRAGWEYEHSIVLANSTVEDLGTRMEASLLGRNVKLTRSEGLPKTLRLLVGDNSVIEIL